MLEQILYHSGKFLYYLENMKRSLGVVCPAGLVVLPYTANSFSENQWVKKDD